jgi:hypothetical protein
VPGLGQPLAGAGIDRVRSPLPDAVGHRLTSKLIRDLGNLDRQAKLSPMTHEAQWRFLMLLKFITASILSVGLATSAMAQSSGAGGGAGGAAGGAGGTSGNGTIGSGASGGAGTSGGVGTGTNSGNTLAPDANSTTNSIVPDPGSTNPSVRGPSGTGNGMGTGTPDCNGMTSTGSSAGLPGGDSSAQVRPNC